MTCLILLSILTEEHRIKAELRSIWFSGSVSSLRLAYKDLEIHMKKEEKVNMSGKKKVESERLGMGLGSCRRYVYSRLLGSRA